LLILGVFIKIGKAYLSGNKYMSHPLMRQEVLSTGDTAKNQTEKTYSFL
jgi:hypothetical protein